MSREQETEILLQAAEKSGRAFLEMECFKQIALSLAQLVDILGGEEKRHEE
jgi:hypothetical protein